MRLLCTCSQATAGVSGVSALISALCHFLSKGFPTPTFTYLSPYLTTSLARFPSLSPSQPFISLLHLLLLFVPF